MPSYQQDTPIGQEEVSIDKPIDSVPEANREPRPVLLRATRLIGDRVRSRTGEDLGTIKDLVVDINTGYISYAVVSFGGVLGLRDKLFAVPWDRLDVDTVNEEFIVNVERRTLEAAPGFDKHHWPDLRTVEWEGEIGSRHTIVGLSQPDPEEAGRLTYGSEGSETAGTGNPPDRNKRRY
jgi:Uncharacterized conserved protein